jgi:hypothetical protein
LVPSSKSLLVANITFVISLKYPLLRKSSQQREGLLMLELPASVRLEHKREG